MLERALIGLEGEKKEQRKNIFHFRYMAQGKVCFLIIEGGSCANIASLSMEEKLKLQAMAHLHPHYMKWLNHNEGLLVNVRCLISFLASKNH